MRSSVKSATNRGYRHEAQSPPRDVASQSRGSPARRPGRRCRLCRHASGNRGPRRRGGCRASLEDPPDPQPLRRGRGRDQRGARKRVRGRPRAARVRHGQRLRLPGRPGRDRGPLRRGARRRLRARALGRGLLAHRGRADRAAPVRRRRRAAHRLRGRHHRPRARPRPLRAGDEALDPGLRGVVRVEGDRGGRPLPGRDRLGHHERRPQGASARRRSSSPPAARAGSTRERRTRTPAPATGWRWRSRWACP